MELSWPQKCLLRMMWVDEYVAWTQVERNRWFYENFFHADTPAKLASAKASLSRSYRRLEKQNIVQMIKHRWELTDWPPSISKDGPGDCGVLVAALAVIDVKKAAEVRERIQAREKARERPED